MSLVKWIRKNNRKIMVFVVIFSMVSFVIGYTGLQILSNIFNPNKRVIAQYADGKKMNTYDLGYAQNELNVLRMMMSDQLLTSQGLGGVLLSYVLFPDSQVTGDIAAQLKQAVQRGQLPISLEELEAYFNQPPHRTEDMWILLKDEAYTAGYVVSTDQAKQYYNSFLTQMVAGQAQDMEQGQVMQYAAQLYSQTIAGIITRANITEADIFRTFGDLLSVAFYANTIMDNQAVTLSEVQALLGRSQERLDAEFVRIDADPFIDEDAEVSEEAVAAQFEAYKAVTPNESSPENPFGFGYKLPRRVQVEYMIVLMDDIQSQTEAPTAEAMEDYYSSNIQRFQTSVPSDPDDPASEKVTETKSFAEVEQQIRTTMTTEKASRLANIIFNEIKDITETGFEQIGFEEATAADLQMAAGEYTVAAEKITGRYNVPLITGKTGWLSAMDLGQDPILSRLQLQQQQTRIALPELLLSVTTDTQQKTRRIGMPTIRMWQNIGPIRGGYFSIEKEKYYNLMAMVRVVGIQSEAVADSIDAAYDTRGVVLFDDEADPEQAAFSLRETVKEDLLLKRAMETAESRAKELAKQIEVRGWDEAIAAYNSQYAPDPNDPDQTGVALTLETIEQQSRASQTDIAQAKRFMRENPSAAAYMQRTLVMDMLNNRLFDLLGTEAQSTGTIHEVIPFEPQASCYVVKSVTRQPATLTDYLDNKPNAAMQLNMQHTAGLALVHFSPENILKRMNFQPKDEITAAPQETDEE
jgi:hypothetical protein